MRCPRACSSCRRVLLQRTRGRSARLRIIRIAEIAKSNHTVSAQAPNHKHSWGATMAGEFEDHCWKDIVSQDILEIYSHYERPTFVGPSPALIAIDLYELSYQG